MLGTATPAKWFAALVLAADEWLQALQANNHKTARPP